MHVTAFSGAGIPIGYTCSNHLIEETEVIKTVH